ncbi:MAG: hypothetical protein OHK0044_33280 [Burkholderiaceae bacterium]
MTEPVRIVVREPVVVTRSLVLPGPPGGIRYVHTQSSAAATWTVNHGLGVRPAVQVVTPGGVTMIADVVHVDANLLQIVFAQPMAGQAILN